MSVNHATAATHLTTAYYVEERVFVDASYNFQIFTSSLKVIVYSCGEHCEYCTYNEMTRD